jgi:hypothetical protein
MSRWLLVGGSSGLEGTTSFASALPFVFIRPFHPSKSGGIFGN